MYTFGPYTLDIEAAELRKGSERLPIRAKCLELLRYLVEHPRTLVTKETLLAEIWSDAVVVEATLTRTMAELRAVLEDDPKSPRFIETVARRGYKFIAGAEPLRETTAEPRPNASFVLIHEGKTYELPNGEYVIGRSVDNDITLPSILVSRQHARIQVLGDTVMLQDLDSVNGTFVNEERVKQACRLNPGDRIRIGNETMLLWWSQGTKTAPGSWQVQP